MKDRDAVISVFASISAQLDRGEDGVVRVYLNLGSLQEKSTIAFIPNFQDKAEEEVACKVIYAGFVKKLAQLAEELCSSKTETVPQTGTEVLKA